MVFSGKQGGDKEVAVSEIGLVLFWDERSELW